MKVWLVWTAAALLSVERIAYILIWRDPATFTSWSTRRAFAIVGGGPVDLLVVLFASFKVIQTPSSSPGTLRLATAPYCPTRAIQQWSPPGPSSSVSARD
jgi:hypothetical protein